MLTHSGSSAGTPNDEGAVRMDKSNRRGGVTGTTVMQDAEATDEQTEGPASGLSSIPVSFWQRDGGCHEGTVPALTAGKVLFIESKRCVPVGTDVTLRLMLPAGDAVERRLLQGTVIWHCPSGDHFAHRKGFGVCLAEAVRS
jgi:hypothetical protein